MTRCSWFRTVRRWRRTVKTAGSSAEGIRVEDGLIGGEDLIVNPPPELKDGDKVKAKQG